MRTFNPSVLSKLLNGWDNSVLLPERVQPWDTYQSAFGYRPQLGWSVDKRLACMLNFPVERTLPDLLAEICRAPGRDSIKVTVRLFPMALWPADVEFIEVHVARSTSVLELKTAVHDSFNEMHGARRLHPFHSLFLGSGMASRRNLPEDSSPHGLQDGAELCLFTGLRGGAGNNLQLIRKPDPYRRAAWRISDFEENGVQLQLHNIQLGEHANQGFGPFPRVDANVREWAVQGFELHVELMPRLAWAPATASNSMVLPRVWHATSLMASALCLHRLDLPPNVKALILDYCALKPEHWFTSGGQHVQGSTTVHSELADDGRIACITAPFVPSVPLPSSGRLRITSPQHDNLTASGSPLPAAEWQVELDPNGSVPEAETEGYEFWNL